MKNLNNFLKFDFDAFSDGKVYLVTDVGEYKDYDTKKHLGTKVECVIAVDKTPYKKSKDGAIHTNKYEKITFKVNKDVEVPLESRVMPKGVTAKVWGDFDSNLSVKCDDIVIVKKEG